MQAAAIPPALEGQDLLAAAQTGTGKTAAFALPLLQKLSTSGQTMTRRPRALILTSIRHRRESSPAAAIITSMAITDRNSSSITTPPRPASAAASRTPAEIGRAPV